MKRKSIDVSVVLKDFTGEPIEDTDQKGIRKPMTMQAALLQMIRLAHTTGLLASADQEQKLYEAGQAIGTAKDRAIMTQAAYDILKRVVDENSFVSNGQKQRLYSLVISQQLKDLVNDAVNVGEKESLE